MQHPDEDRSTPRAVLVCCYCMAWLPLTSDVKVQSKLWEALRLTMNSRFMDCDCDALNNQWAEFERRMRTQPPA